MVGAYTVMERTAIALGVDRKVYCEIGIVLSPANDQSSAFAMLSSSPVKLHVENGRMGQLRPGFLSGIGKSPAPLSARLGKDCREDASKMAPSPFLSHSHYLSLCSTRKPTTGRRVEIAHLLPTLSSA